MGLRPLISVDAHEERGPARTALDAVPFRGAEALDAQILIRRQQGEARPGACARRDEVRELLLAAVGVVHEQADVGGHDPEGARDPVGAGLYHRLDAIDVVAARKRGLELRIPATDLEATVARVKEHGGAIAREIFSFPGGRRFHFTDPTGNELAVWSDR